MAQIRRSAAAQIGSRASRSERPASRFSKGSFTSRPSSCVVSASCKVTGSEPNARRSRPEWISEGFAAKASTAEAAMTTALLAHDLLFHIAEQQRARYVLAKLPQRREQDRDAPEPCLISQLRDGNAELIPFHHRPCGRFAAPGGSRCRSERRPYRGLP